MTHDKPIVPVTELDLRDTKSGIPLGEASLKTQGEKPDVAARAQHGLSSTRKIMLASTIMLTYFMMALSVGSSLLTIPVMADYFRVSQLAVQWVASAYTLAYGCGLLVAGRLADLYGRKKLFIIGLIIGCIANIISGVVPNRIALCIIRAIAGLGLALSTPAGFGILGVNFREEPVRTMAFAALGVGSPLGAAVGEVLGGVMASAGSRGWQYLYFVIAGVGVFPILGGYWFIPPDSGSLDGVMTNNRIDWLGAMVITIALGLFGFSITQSGLEPNGWKTPYVPTLFALSVMLILFFGYWEHYAQYQTSIPPIVRLDIFTRHKWRITAVLAIAFLDWMGICGWVYLTSVWYQELQGYSPLMNALYILPGPITGMICSYLVTLLAPRVKAPILLIIGGISTGMANCLFAFQNPDTLYWKCSFFGAIFHPFGGDLTIPIGSVLISNLCADDEQSVAGALFQVALQLAATIDICASSFILVKRTEAVGLLTGLREAFWFNAAACWLVIPITLIALWRVGLAKDVREVL